MYEKDNRFLLQKLFFTFFGSDSLPRGIVIIVPIEKIFKKIKDSFPLEEATKGWWKRAVVKINSSSVTILKIPSGSNYIRDCLGILGNLEIKGILFLGYCASFSKEIKIGEIIIPIQALFRKKRVSLFKQKFWGLSKNKRYKIALLQQLLLPREKIKKIKAQLGDMETYFLYKFSKTKRIPALALLIVTDNPLFYPFYCISKVDKIKIKSSLKKLMILLKQYIHTAQKIK